MTAPSMFSSANPRLQRAWDATSLKSLMSCPRRYQYEILEGWRAEGNDDLDFGRFFASAVETYKKARLEGQSKEEATIQALRYVVEATGGDDPDRPWSGSYETMWRCTGTEAYRNTKGNRAKCPWSHKGTWVPGLAPDTCGHCGSPTETSRRWSSGNPAKDRYALFRLVAWWCEDQAENAEDGVMMYKFPDGTPAVELSFSFPLPWSTPGRVQPGYQDPGEPYLLSGHLDGIDTLGTENFIGDNKTTKMWLGDTYWGQYAPNIQVSVYDLAAVTLFQDLNIRGVRIDAAQTMIGGARFGARVFYSNDTLRKEFLTDLEWWIRQAEKMAEDGYWPMNRASCYMCPFKIVCSRDPERREGVLKANFHKRFWNPLEER